MDTIAARDQEGVGMEAPRPASEHAWRARSVRPVIALQVVVVFVAFMALAWFVFHSPGAVQALGLTAVGALVSTLPGILTRIEYRLTPRGLLKRRARQDVEFQEVFSWEEISHFVPTSSGFNFYKRIPPSNRLIGFFRRHVSDHYSGEMRVEDEDRELVRTIIDDHEVPVRTRRDQRRIMGQT